MEIGTVELRSPFRRSPLVSLRHASRPLQRIGEEDEDTEKSECSSMTLQVSSQASPAGQTFGDSCVHMSSQLSVSESDNPHEDIITAQLLDVAAKSTLVHSASLSWFLNCLLLVNFECSIVVFCLFC